MAASWAVSAASIARGRTHRGQKNRAELRIKIALQVFSLLWMTLRTARGVFKMPSELARSDLERGARATGG
jgi:hypothetical protein